jgi:hypothetical protein
LTEPASYSLRKEFKKWILLINWDKLL